MEEFVYLSVLLFGFLLKIRCSGFKVPVTLFCSGKTVLTVHVPDFNTNLGKHFQVLQIARLLKFEATLYTL